MSARAGGRCGPIRIAVGCLVVAVVAAGCRAPNGSVAGPSAATTTRSGAPSSTAAASTPGTLESQPVLQLGHAATVRALAFSVNGKRLASADDEGKLLIWDVPARRVSGVLEVDPFVVHAAWSKDGQRLIVVSTGASEVKRPGRVTVWDLASGKPARTIDLPEVIPVAGAVSPDERRVAVLDKAGVTHLSPLDGAPGTVKLVGTRPGDDLHQPTLTFSADGRRLAAGNRIFDVGSATVVADVPWDQGRVAAFGLGGSTVYLAKGRNVIEWDLEHGVSTSARPAVTRDQSPRDLYGPSPDQGEVESVFVRGDGAVFAFVRWNRRGVLARLDSNEVRRAPSAWPAGGAVAFSGAFPSLATAEESDVFVSAAAVEPAALAPRWRTVPVAREPIAIDGARVGTIWDTDPVAFRGRERTATVLDFSVSTPAVLSRARVDWIPRFDAVRFAGAGKLVAEDAADAGIFDVADGRKVAALELKATAVDVSRDGSILLGAYEPQGDADDPCSATVWDVATLKRLSFSSSDTCAPALSPDGRWIATKGRHNEVTLWDVRRDRAAFVLSSVRTGGSYVLFRNPELQFSRDGRYLADWNHVWDLQTRQPVATLDFQGGVQSVSAVFSSAARFLVVRIGGTGYSKERPAGMLVDRRVGHHVDLPIKPEVLAVSEDEGTLLAADAESIHVLDASNFTPLGKVPRRSTSVHTTLSFSPDGRAFLEDGEVLTVVRRDPNQGWAHPGVLDLGRQVSPGITTRWFAGGRLLLLLSRGLRAYRVSDGRWLDFVYVGAPDGPGSLLTLSDRGEFDGDAQALSVLALRRGSILDGRVEAVTRASPGFQAGLFARFLAGR